MDYLWECSVCLQRYYRPYAQTGGDSDLCPDCKPVYEIKCIQASVAWLEQKIALDQAEIKRLNDRLKFLEVVRYKES